MLGMTWRAISVGVLRPYEVVLRARDGQRGEEVAAQVRATRLRGVGVPVQGAVPATQGGGRARFIMLATSSTKNYTSARHIIHQIVYRCPPRHPPHSVPVLARSPITHSERQTFSGGWDWLNAHRASALGLDGRYLLDVIMICFIISLAVRVGAEEGAGVADAAAAGHHAGLRVRARHRRHRRYRHEGGRHRGHRCGPGTARRRRRHGARRQGLAEI